MLGNEYYRRRQFTRAIEQFKRALALKPDYDLVVINMANAYRALGRDQEAMVGYRRFMELDPKNAQIRYEAAQILIDGGKLDEARQRTDAGARARAEAGRRAQRARRPGAAARRPRLAPSARFARRSTRSPTSGSRTSTWRCSPSSRATCRAPSRNTRRRLSSTPTATRPRSTSAGFTRRPAIARARSRQFRQAIEHESGLCRGPPVSGEGLPRP